MLWLSGPLTLTKKSKFSKQTCLTQFFAYIPILGPVSSFEAQKLCKCPISKSWLLHKCWPKSKNFQERRILPNFSCRFDFWDLFLHSGIRNCSNSMILQLLALMWTLTKNQDVCAKLVLFRFSHGFWFWNLLICFGLGNHLCDTLLRSTNSVQNLSSQDQNLRFIHLIWILSRLFSRLYQGFPSKVQMNSHKCVLNLILHWVTNSTYHSRSMPTSLQPTIPVRCLPFPATSLTKNSQPPFSTTQPPFFVSPL